MNNEPIYPPLTEEELDMIKQAKKKRVRARTTEILEEQVSDVAAEG